MTLVVVRLEEEFAEILTDTLSYANQLVELGRCSKGIMLPHLDAAVFSRGSGGLLDAWGALVRGYEGDFDGLNRAAPAALAVCWEHVQPRLDPARPDSERDHGVSLVGWVFHVGWSPEAGRFVGYEFNSATDWQPQPLDQLTVFSALETAAYDALPVPASDDDWLALAAAVFVKSALALPGEGKCVIGDDLILTRVELGASSQRRIGSIPTDSAEFRQALIGTCHIAGQLGPCPCGSGGPYAVCCPGYFDPRKPCLCGRPLTFGECHLVDPRSPEALAYWTAHPEDFSGPLNLTFIYERADEIAAYWNDLSSRAQSA